MKPIATFKTLLLTFLLLSTCSAGAEWVRVFRSNGDSFYFDPIAIRKDGGQRTVWQLQDLKRRNKAGVRSIRARVEYDCDAERGRLLSLSEHSKSMASGKEINTYQLKNESWTDVPPNSADAATLKMACTY